MLVASRDGMLLTSGVVFDKDAEVIEDEDVNIKEPEAFTVTEDGAIFDTLLTE